EPVVIERSQIRDLRASAISMMPEGYKQLGDAKLKDLLAFLTTAQADDKTPPQRSRAEVDAVLAKTPKSGAEARPIKLLLVANPKDHGPGEHDYPAWQKKWAPLLGKVAKTEVTTAFPWPTEEQWGAADLAVLYLWGKWDEPQLKDVDAFLARGGGLVALHSAVIPKEKPLELAARLGLSWEPGKTKFRHGPLELDFAEHAITAGLPKSKFIDESYWPLVGELKGGQVLATQVEEGASRPMAWVYEVGKGRTFSTLLGHYSWTFDDPYFRILVLRAMSWAVREPLDRFDKVIFDP
ncbi:MAG: ThuA domain-containing protein, partial [Planctomycetes bacterium]|nr:ThuA domain-containing protein [Planctomycetota bacterium]